jgi:hypothetical protein
MSGEPVTLFVGDIHGCYEELIALVELAVGNSIAQSSRSISVKPGFIVVGA